jgi:hypothetical protein
MSKWKVFRCMCSEQCRTGRLKRWIAVDRNGYVTEWASWQRAMLRATKGY